MRDPLTWSIPLPRLFGISIRVHFLFPIVAAGLILYEAQKKDALPGLWIEAAVLMGLLFLSVLLHELGHCFGARSVDGEANEILLWPLGGLAFAKVPHTPRCNFITAAAGPAVNLVLAISVMLLLLPAGLTPSFAPWADPYFPVVHNWSEDAYYGSKTGRGDLWKFTAYQVVGSDQYVSADEIDLTEKGPVVKKTGKPCDVILLHPDKVALELGEKKEQLFVYVDKEKKQKSNILVHAEALPHHALITLATRFFWVNWFLLLLNLVPAYPLDGGRLLQSILWWRTEYRQATHWAIFAGFLMMFVCILLGIILYDPLVLGLAIFMYIYCRRQWILLETGGEESLFGYDFSQGYTSLEREQPPPRRRPNWFQRWLARRAERKIRHDLEQREAEERRMDELLEKVQRVKWQGLTEEERRFLTRVSARYRHRHE